MTYFGTNAAETSTIDVTAASQFGSLQWLLSSNMESIDQDPES